MEKSGKVSYKLLSSKTIHSQPAVNSFYWFFSQLQSREKMESAHFFGGSLLTVDCLSDWLLILARKISIQNPEEWKKRRIAAVCSFHFLNPLLPFQTARYQDIKLSLAKISDAVQRLQKDSAAQAILSQRLGREKDPELSQALDSLIGIVSQMEQGLTALQRKVPASNRDLLALREAMDRLTRKVQTTIQVNPSCQRQYSSFKKNEGQKHASQA